MSGVDAYALLMSEFAPYRELRYDELTKFVGQSSSRVVRGKDANDYVIDVAVCWLDQEQQRILVKGMAAVADCGPLRRVDESFVVSPPGDAVSSPG
jgi:hypothetical protein